MLIQEPGDLVVTMPNAWHMGVNLDYNECEAANFALSDWVGY